MKHHDAARDPRLQCLGKVRHKNEQAAHVAAHRNGGVGIHPYHCPHCRGWHVGNASGAHLKRMYQR